MKGSSPIKDWYRLDNAAKIFPPTTDKRDSNVFRFSCVLFEAIEPQRLQEALDKTLPLFPFYQSVIKKGLFWHYFEVSDLPLLVKEESKPPCSPLYDKYEKKLLIEVSYFQNRIHLEIFHALSDGRGALEFLRLLVYHYLVLSHEMELPQDLQAPSYGASVSQKSEDSFSKYYLPHHKKKNKRVKAYQLRGAKLPEGRIHVIEGAMPLGSALQNAKQSGYSLTVYLAAALLCAIEGGMATRHKSRPVTLAIPVNLRNYFESGSARNFFGLVNIGYDFSKNPSDFQSVLTTVGRRFEEELTTENLETRMSMLIAAERNIFARIVPLSIKNPILYAVSWYRQQGMTCTLSNIGVIDMPEALRPYINQFEVFTGTEKMNVCLCSHGNRLVISFSSIYENTEVERRFFRFLSQAGIEIKIASNLVEGIESW